MERISEIGGDDFLEGSRPGGGLLSLPNPCRCLCSLPAFRHDFAPASARRPASVIRRETIPQAGAKKTPGGLPRPPSDDDQRLVAVGARPVGEAAGGGERTGAGGRRARETPRPMSDCTAAEITRVRSHHAAARAIPPVIAAGAPTAASWRVTKQRDIRPFGSVPFSTAAESGDLTRLLRIHRH